MMKSMILALVAVSILAGCDAGTGKQQSAAHADTQRKTDDATKVLGAQMNHQDEFWQSF